MLPFIEFIQFLVDESSRDGMVGILKGQHTWIEDVGGVSLLDQVIRLDDLGSEYPRLCEKLGISTQRPVWLNRSGNAFYDHGRYYSLEARNLVEDIFQRDLEKYHFEFSSRRSLAQTSQSNKSITLYCSSLGNPSCGIASYTMMLSRAKGVPAISRIPQFDNGFPKILHLQYEPGITGYRELKSITKFCDRNGIELLTTMHHVRLRKQDKLFSSMFSDLRKLASLVVRGMQYTWEMMLGSGSSGRDKLQGLRKHQMNYWARFVVQRHIFSSGKVVVHSPSAKSELISQGADPERVRVQYHPIEDFSNLGGRHSAEDAKLHVGIFGFMSPQKNVLALINACRPLADRVQLHIIASTERYGGEIPDNLKETLGAAEREEWVDLVTETIPLDEVINRLSRNCVNVYLTVPTDISSSGAIRQYLASRRPIVAYRSPMIEDVESLCILIDDLDPETIRGAILHASSQKTVRLESYIEENSWERSHSFYDQM